MNPDQPQPDATATLDDARRLLRERFGHEDFRGGQAEVVASALAGKNLLVVMPTGAGKSLLYQLPALLAEGLTLVVSPLIALMKDQVDELQRRGVAAAFINSSISPDQQRETIDRCCAGEIQLLYVAPERFRSSSFLRMLDQVTIARLAVDEAHCISEWGHDFRPDYRRIKQFRTQMGEPIVTALTATATPRVQRDIIAALGLEPDDVEVHVRGFDRANLKLRVERARNDNHKIAFLRDFIRTESGAGIIYVGTRRAAEQVAQEMRSLEPRTTMYHAGLEPDQRARAQEAFLTGEARIAVATVAFGMGIDKADVRFVVHYHFPGSVEQYYQEIGRAGRDGLDSRCVLLYSSADRFLREFFIDLSYPSREQVKSVMDALFATPDNPVMLTYGQIAERCDTPVKDGQVGAALRLLSSAGLARPLDGVAAATVVLSRPGAEIDAALKGKVQKSVFEALAIAGDLETPGELEVNLDQLARAASVTVAQAQRALAALDAAGHVEYHPPFRGRGVEKLVEAPPPFERADIDWETQDFLRSLEEEKLQTMESYIRTRACRRAFIVKYFGEKDGFVCGDCDCCLAAGDGAAAEKGDGGDDVLAREPRIASAVLACVANLRFPLGVGRTAQVVTGSRDSKLRQWGLDDNCAYGAAGCSQDRARDVIDQLVADRYLRRIGDYERPVLDLTDKGRRAAEAIDLSDLPAPTAAPAPTTPARPAAAVGGDALTHAALRCVDELTISVGVSRIAAVLTGSNAAWIHTSGADRLSAYNCTSLTQQDAREHVSSLIEAGLLHRTGHGRYKVIELTAAGREALRSSDDDDEVVAQASLDLTTEPPAPERPEAAVERLAPAPRPTSEPSLVCPADAAAEPSADLAAPVSGLLAGDRREAAAALADLRRFHPTTVAEALAEAWAGADTQRGRARTIWAAGELCGAEATAFLTEAAASPVEVLRTQAAAALGKIAARACAAALEINRRMPEIHETLQQLLGDADAGVRTAAERAVGQLTGESS